VDDPVYDPRQEAMRRLRDPGQLYAATIVCVVCGYSNTIKVSPGYDLEKYRGSCQIVNCSGEMLWNTMAFLRKVRQR